MVLENRRIKILIIVLITLIVFGGLLGLLLWLLLYQQPYIELEVWPRPTDTEQELIEFKAAEPDSWHSWVRRINEFLRVYETSVPEDPPHAPCSTHQHHEEPQRSEHCSHAMRYWAPCTVDTLYGYIMGTPCVFLRLSHIDQWTPQPYNLSASLPIPLQMPEHVKEGMKHPSARYEDYVWVSCKGESPVDDENIGRIQYIPESLPPGFPIRRLRTTDADNNLINKDGGPLLAVFFPNLTRGVVINVECRIWSRDVVYDANRSVGSTLFKILVV